MPFLHHMYLLPSNCLPLLSPSKHFLLDTPMVTDKKLCNISFQSFKFSNSDNFCCPDNAKMHISADPKFSIKQWLHYSIKQWLHSSIHTVMSQKCSSSSQQRTNWLHHQSQPHLVDLYTLVMPIQSVHVTCTNE